MDRNKEEYRNESSRLCAQGTFMTDTASFPYETRLNILHGPLEIVDAKAMAEACEFKWFNQTLCQVNSSVVRLGVFEGEYHWHKHDEDDEFFYVMEGRLFIDLEDRVVELAPGQGFVVPRTVAHRTRAPQRTSVLMVENAGIIPTGN
jgi:mannose-6-phosphate isomerase-like protein (cupin superfamily)